MSVTRMEILNAGEMAYYKPFISNAKDKDTLHLFLQRVKSKKVKKISILSSFLSLVPLDNYRDLHTEIVYGYPFGLNGSEYKAEEIDSVLTSYQANRLPRPAICWVADTARLSRMETSHAEQERMEYLCRRHFSDKPHDFRVMVDPSICSKEALDYFLSSNKILFKRLRATLTLGSLMGYKEVPGKLVEDLDDDYHIKVNCSIKTTKQFESWLGCVDLIGTPFLDRVLDGY